MVEAVNAEAEGEKLMSLTALAFPFASSARKVSDVHETMSTNLRLARRKIGIMSPGFCPVEGQTKRRLALQKRGPKRAAEPEKSQGTFSFGA